MRKTQIIGTLLVAILVLLGACAPTAAPVPPAPTPTPAPTPAPTPVPAPARAPKSYNDLGEVIYALLQASPKEDRKPKSEFDTDAEYEARLNESFRKWRAAASSYFIKAQGDIYIIEREVKIPKYDLENKYYLIKEYFETWYRIKGEGVDPIIDPVYVVINAPRGIEVYDYDIYDPSGGGSPSSYLRMKFNVDVPVDIAKEIRNSETEAGPLSIRMYLQLAVPDIKPERDAYAFYYYYPFEKVRIDIRQREGRDEIIITITKAVLIDKGGKVLYTWQ